MDLMSYLGVLKLLYLMQLSLWEWKSQNSIFKQIQATSLCCHKLFHSSWLTPEGGNIISKELIDCKILEVQQNSIMKVIMRLPKKNEKWFQPFIRNLQKIKMAIKRLIIWLIPKVFCILVNFEILETFDGFLKIAFVIVKTSTGRTMYFVSGPICRFTAMRHYTAIQPLQQKKNAIEWLIVPDGLKIQFKVINEIKK